MGLQARALSCTRTSTSAATRTSSHAANASACTYDDYAMYLECIASTRKSLSVGRRTHTLLRSHTTHKVRGPAIIAENTPPKSVACHGGAVAARRGDAVPPLHAHTPPYDWDTCIRRCLRAGTLVTWRTDLALFVCSLWQGMVPCNSPHPQVSAHCVHRGSEPRRTKLDAHSYIRASSRRHMTASEEPGPCKGGHGRAAVIHGWFAQNTTMQPRRAEKR